MPKASPRGSSEDQPVLDSLVKAVELVGVHLIDAKSSLALDRLQPEQDDALELAVQPPDYRGEFHEEQSVLYCGVRLRLTLARPNEEAIVAISTEYALFYHLPCEFKPTDTAVRHFASQNAVFNAWPFFREHVCSTVAKMGLPPLIIPLFRLSPAGPK